MGAFANFQPLPIDFKLDEIAKILMQRQQLKQQALDRAQRQVESDEYRRFQMANLTVGAISRGMRPAGTVPAKPEDPLVRSVDIPPEGLIHAAKEYEAYGLEAPSKGVAIGEQVFYPDPTQLAETQGEERIRKVRERHISAQAIAAEEEVKTLPEKAKRERVQSMSYALSIALQAEKGEKPDIMQLALVGALAQDPAEKAAINKQIQEISKSPQAQISPEVQEIRKRLLKEVTGWTTGAGIEGAEIQEPPKPQALEPDEIRLGPNNVFKLSRDFAEVENAADAVYRAEPDLMAAKRKWDLIWDKWNKLYRPSDIAPFWPGYPSPTPPR